MPAGMLISLEYPGFQDFWQWNIFFKNWSKCVILVAGSRTKGEKK
jgi:hypothetical protein